MENDKTSDLNLDQDFAPPSWNEWLQAVQDMLKGADFDKVMKTKTYDGITLSPIYRKEDLDNVKHLQCLPGEAPYVRGSNANGYLEQGWYVAQAQDNPDLEELNTELLDELNRGLTAINLKLHKDTLAGKAVTDETTRGLALSCLEDLKCLFNNVDLTAVPVYIQAGSSAMAILGLLNAYIKDKGYALKTLQATIGADPIAEYAEHGKLPYSFETMWQMMYQMAFWADIKAPKIKTICIDAPVYAKAGASSVQELGIALATAIGYIKGLLESGLSIEQVAPRFQLNLSLGSNFFMEIAKVRAARLIWSDMIKAFGGSDEAQKIFIHGVTSKFNKSIYDPWVNVLRTSTESFAAVIGGVDSMEVGTYNELTGAQDTFSKRIARNQQIILREEAHFDRVIDPAGGCYYIEALTSELAQKAWGVMQDIEAGGGMLKTLQAGSIHTLIAEVAETRIGNVDKRRDVFVGVNMYSNPEEKTDNKEKTTKPWLENAQQRLGIRKASNGKSESLSYLTNNLKNEYLVDMVTDAWMHGANIAEISQALGFGAENVLSVGKLDARRAMQNIENLRQKVESTTANRSIFMCNIGKLAQIKPRLDFSVGFLQVAGFKIINPGAFETIEDALAEYAKSGANALCICATDDTYVSIVDDLCKEAKANPIILAGFPADMIESYKQSGVQIFIHLKANVYLTLLEIATNMGVI